MLLIRSGRSSSISIGDCESECVAVAHSTCCQRLLIGVAGAQRLRREAYEQLLDSGLQCSELVNGRFQLAECGVLLQ